MKTILLLLAASLTAAAASPSQLAISAPHHPGATVRIVTHGCEGAALVWDNSIIASQLDVRLDDQGNATTRLLVNDSEVRCNYVPGIKRPTWYGVQVVGSNQKEKIVKIRAGKTSKVRL
jgi:hypothetical protein